MTDDYLPILSNLLKINSVTGNSLVRGSPSDSPSWSHITLNKGQYVLKGLTHISKFLHENRSSSAVVFCNCQSKLQHFRNNLEQKLNKMKLNIAVIYIKESLHKIDKFWRIHLFCDNTHICKAHFRVLITTNAANIVIDKHSTALQMLFDWPRDLLRIFQECSCGSGQVEAMSMRILYTDLASYVFLVTHTREVILHVNSLTAKSILAGEKLILFGWYVLNLYVGIVPYILCKLKTQHAKIYLPTKSTNWQLFTSTNKIHF
jgi:hypothetical protein